MSTISPSKKYLFRVLKNFLLIHKNKPIGIDLASENFKNSIYFKTKKYIGVDLNKKEILFGLKYFKDKKRYGIHWDFTKKNILGENFADVVVSTNTLSHIKSPKKKIDALNNFIQFTSSDGVIFLQTEIEKKVTNEIIKKINSNFKKVKIKYYNNLLTKIYLSLFLGKLTNNKVAIFFNKIKLNYFLSLIENITCYFKILNTKMIIIAAEKKNFGKKKIKFKFKRINKFL